MKRLRTALLLALALAALLAITASAGAQAAMSAIQVTCPGGGSINNGVSIAVNVRPGTYLVTVIGINGFDPVLAIWDSAAGRTLNCSDDAPGASTYSALLPTTGLISPSSLSAQLQIVNQSADFRDFYAVVGGFGDGVGEALVIFEELAVTPADGSGPTAGDPFYVELTQNLLNSQVPVTAYMISLTTVLDPYITLINNEAVATIDGIPAICDDAGTPARCFGDPGSLTSSYITYTAPNGDNYNLLGYAYDAALRFDPMLLAQNGLQFAEMRLSSFNQSTFGDYVAAFHIGIGVPDASGGGGVLGGSTGAISGGQGGSLTGAAGQGGSLTGGANQGGSLTGAAGQGGSLTGGAGTTGTAIALTCNDNARTAALANLAIGQSTVVTCPANCRGAIWGTGVYTDDSAVCAAGVHAGVIPPAGGQFLLTIAPGLPSYPASTANGITSNQWGSWSRSFIPSPVSGSALPSPTSFGGSLAAGKPAQVDGRARLNQDAAQTGPAAATTISVTGSLTPENNISQYTFTGMAGDVITLTATAQPSGSFDTVLSLFAADSSQTVARNDDHGTSDPALAPFDSRIASFTLPATGAYRVEVTSFSGRTPGDYRLTLTIERAADPASYQLELLAPVAPVSSVRFVPPALAGAYTTPDGVTIPLPQGWLTRETLGGSILASTQAALDGASASPVDYRAFGQDGIVLQVVPRSLVTAQPGQSAAQVLSALTGIAVGQTFALTSVGAEAGVVRLLDTDAPSNIEVYAFAVDYADGPAQDYVVFLLATAIPADRNLQTFFEDLLNQVTLSETTAQPTSTPAAAGSIPPLFGPPVEPTVYSAPTTALDLGDNYSILLPDGWVFEAFDNRIVMADDAEALRRVVEANTGDRIALPPDALVVVVFRPGLSAQIVGSGDLFDGLSQLNAQMETAVTVDGLGDAAASAALAPARQPDGGLGYVTIVDFDGQPLAFTALTSHRPGQIVQQMRDLIASVAFTPSLGAEPQIATAEPQTFEFDDGSALTLSVPGNWVVEVDREAFTLMGATDESTLQQANRGAAARDLPERAFSFALGLPRALADQGIAAGDLDGLVAGLIETLGDGRGTVLPLAEVVYPAARVELPPANGTPEDVNLIAFITDGGPFLLAYLANQPDDKALETAVAIVNSVVYQDGASAAGSTETTGVQLGEPRTFTFDDGSRLTLALPAGWVSDSQAQSFVIAAGSDDAAFDYITGNSSQPAPAGAIGFQLGLTRAIEGILGAAPTDLDDTASAFVRALGGSGTPRPLTALRYPAVIAQTAGTQVLPGLTLIVFETPGGILLLGYVAGPDLEADAALATISAIIDSIDYTAGR